MKWLCPGSVSNDFRLAWLRPRTECAHVRLFACSVSLDNAPYVKILSHVRLLGISTHSDQGKGRRFHFELVRDWDKPRSLVTNAVRRGPSSSVSAVNFNPSPLPGFTCRTTASALICPS